VNIFNKEYILSIPKTINENGCWIPTQKPESTGYIHITVNGFRFLLHRLSMCIQYNVEYDNKEIITRHSKDCLKACFNPEHLKSGSDSENQLDRVEHGNHYNANKLVCPKCGSKYKIRLIKIGIRKGKFRRDCPICSNNWNRKKS
jgi:predicted Zn finger-like uncharacterized protein